MDVTQQTAECLAISHFLAKSKDSGARFAIRQDLLEKVCALSADEIAVLIGEKKCDIVCELTKPYGTITAALSRKLLDYRNSSMKKKKCLIFVHGLGSSHEKTWTSMENLVKSHELIDSEWETISYEYETSKIKLIPEFLFRPRYLGIPMLAKGLKSLIDIRCKSYDSIVIIGHSMGGLITAKFLTTELPRMDDPKIKGALFFATPFNGSQLANIADSLSIKHKQVRVMMKGSDETNELIESFKEMVETKKIPHRIILGGQDKAVPPEHFYAMFGHKDTLLLQNKNHQSITQCASHSEDTFEILSRFILELEN